LMFETMIFNYADVEFQCCTHVMLSVVSRGEGGGPLMFGCCTRHGSQHARNMALNIFFYCKSLF
jgi:hypothetical protein